MKTCRSCGIAKPLPAFNRQVGVRDGRAPDCKACDLAKRRTPEYRAKQREKYRTPRRWAALVLQGARRRARAEGVPFDLTPEDITAPDACPVLGIPLSIGEGKLAPGSPTLDRLVPSKGYVEGNVHVISWAANKIKGGVTDPTVFDRLAAYLRQGTGG